ncbi:MAG: helix-turn-helix domain-containing protein [Thermoprotei archaeon]
MMFEYLLELDHSLPLNNVSKKFPEAQIDRWCNGRVDYVEVVCPSEEMCKLVSSEIGSTMSKRNPDLLQVHIEGKKLNSTVRCVCAPSVSSFAMAEKHNCLWKSPIKYRSGKEYLSIISFSDVEFQSLFSEYEALGEARILRKAPISKESITNSLIVAVDGLLSDLTPRQLESMVAALNYGYYDIPKAASVSEIARHLGLSPSTVEEHLSKAEMKLAKALEPYLKMYRASKPEFTLKTSLSEDSD